MVGKDYNKFNHIKGKRLNQNNKVCIYFTMKKNLTLRKSWEPFNHF